MSTRSDAQTGTHPPASTIPEESATATPLTNTVFEPQSSFITTDTENTLDPAAYDKCASAKFHAPIVIFGGRSLVGPYLFQHLAEAKLTAEVISRETINLPPGFSHQKVDLNNVRAWSVPENAIVLSLAPLWVLARHLPRFLGAQSIVALGSTSRFAKIKSKDPKERAIAESLSLAEDILTKWSAKCQTRATILRPTLIYDGKNDRNITRVANFIRRFGFFPVAKPANGLRQPIHADDVAAAIMGAMGNACVYDQALNISGGEVLPYYQMIARVFEALDKKPRLLPLPTKQMEFCFKLLTSWGLLQEKSFGFSIFKRMNEDLIFDSEFALKSLPGYHPRPFTTTHLFE